MAVTQQMARVGEALLSQCRRDVHQLDDLCSFRALRGTDYLDLDWAPHLLQAAAVIADIGADALSGLAASFTGEAEINPRYRELPDTVWEHPVAYLSAARVREVNQVLQSLTYPNFLSDDTIKQAILGLPPDVRPDNPGDYLHAHFQALSRFYLAAAEQGLCVVMWWD